MPRGSAVAAMLLAAMAMRGADAEPAPVALAQANLPDTSEGRAAAVARMVRGILDYSHWPSAPAPIRVCLAGAPALAGRLAGTAGLAVRPGAVRAGDCDAVYLGAMAAADKAALLARLRGTAVVTIDEADPACRAGAMFCLRAGRGGLGFELNLDAVSRSTVRIDPRVLRLSWSAGGGA